MSILKQLVDGFVKSELDLFKKQFDESPVLQIQDDRSLAIAWLCYYFKDVISREYSVKIINFVNQVSSRENYNVHGWYRISALQAAAYILTKDSYYANMLVQRICCGQSWARGFILQSAGLICPILSFDNQHLRKATEINIEYSHGNYQDNIILYLSTKGEVSEKLDWIETQIRTVKYDDQKNFFDSIIKMGHFTSSSLFISAFNRAKSYLIFKILSQPIPLESEPTLFDTVHVSYYTLSNLEKKHPLNSFYIDLGFLSRSS